MGSKNLKAIAVRGNKKVEIADKEALKTARKFFTTAMKESEVLYPAFSKLGHAHGGGRHFGHGHLPLPQLFDHGRH